MAVDKSNRRIRQMFGEIAGRYDFLNHVLSFSVDRYWRWKTVRLVRPEGGLPLLDVCTGTGDLALAYAKAIRGKSTIVGADFCREMLVIGRNKVQRRTYRVRFVEADAQGLPFDADRFQIVSVAFGLRNVYDTDRALVEMTRVCAPGGTVAILEFSMPAWPPARALYGWYFRTILPKIGRLFAGNAHAAYQYLPDSVGEFESGPALADRMRNVGLVNVRARPLTGGIAALYTGEKRVARRA